MRAHYKRPRPACSWPNLCRLHCFRAIVSHAPYLGFADRMTNFTSWSIDPPSISTQKLWVVKPYATRKQTSLRPKDSHFFHGQDNELHIWKMMHCRTRRLFRQCEQGSCCAKKEHQHPPWSQPWELSSMLKIIDQSNLKRGRHVDRLLAIKCYWVKLRLAACCLTWYTPDQYLQKDYQHIVWT